MRLPLLLLVCVLSRVHGQTPVVIEPELIEGRDGDNVTITCIVGAVEPSATQLLTNDRQTLPVLSQDLQTDRVVFVYGPISRQNDSGRLVICDFGTRNATGTISVLYPPLYAVDNALRLVAEGTSPYTVMLNVTGNPLPTIQETTLTFNGGPIGTGVTLGADSISFDSLTREHSGMYSISSTTTAGQSNMLDIQINVLYPPMFTAGPATGIACRLNSPSGYLCAMRPGSSGTLNCATVGNPSPTLTITESSDQISGSEVSGEVTVSSVTIADSGSTVQCSAMNSQATEQRDFVIYVGSGPAEPTSVSASIQSNMVVVSWSWSDPGNAVPLTQFMLTVTRDGESTPVLSETTTDTTFNIALTALESNTLYNIAVRADNLLESSGPVGAQVTTPIISGGGSGSAMAITSCLLSVLLMAVLTLAL